LRFPASKVVVVSAVLALLTAKVPAQSPQPATPTKQHAGKSHRRHAKSRKSSWKRHGQQGMRPDRVRAIQEALIREKYLTGEPTGTWDARTQDAMTRYQNDNGWQSKVTPDSRALIKLGLGPSYSEKELLQLGPQPAAGAVAANGATANSNKQ
jgi:peptidoglycan hydrolase-like protein with peptidoglycan-binding domain